MNKFSVMPSHDTWFHFRKRVCDLVTGGRQLDSFAIFQYLSLRTNAADLGCRWRVNIPFLFPKTRVVPAEKLGDKQNISKMLLYLLLWTVTVWVLNQVRWERATRFLPHVVRYNGGLGRCNLHHLGKINCSNEQCNCSSLCFYSW